MVVKKIDLGDLVKIKTGRLDANAAVIDGIFPFFTCAREVSRINTYAFEGECVLVAGNGDLNVKYYNGKFNAYQRTYVIEPIDKTSLSPKYLYYFLQSYIEELRGKTIGGVIQYIKLENLKEPKIPLPSLSTQKAIAEKLDKADALRKKDKELLAQYDELAQAIFIDMFGDPVRNEKGWEVKQVHDITLPIKNLGRATEPDTIQYVDISSIDNIRKRIVNSTSYKIDERPSRAQQILKISDILLSTVRPNLKNIAINTNDDFIGSTGFYVFRCKEIINPHFLFEFLNSDSVTSELESMVSGANYPALKSSDIKFFDVIIPPIDLQNQFAEKIQNIEAQKAIVKQQAQQSEDLFQALLQESFNFN